MNIRTKLKSYSQGFTGDMAMQKPSKNKRQMFLAFSKEYKDIPASFIMRSLDNFLNLGSCFDALEDYETYAAQEFDYHKKTWQSKKL
jgi:hypothetical protein